ncbi:MAG: SDR family NAD(P)-dependent oxidoreductase, partial [Acidimicrobiaceae bacterium]
MSNPQLALITGASSGIGREFAKSLAKNGYDIIAVARRRELLESLASELQIFGAQT